MGRGFRQKKYVSGDALWAWIEERQERMSLMSKEPLVKESEVYRLIMLGRKEILDALAEYVLDEEMEGEDLCRIWGLTDAPEPQ